MTGQLTIAATPIGNPGDASARLREALAGAALVAAEDTRRLRRLAADLDVRVRGRVISFFEGNERRRTDEVMAELEAGRDVLLVSDGGMPTISDPGYALVSRCAAAGIDVTVLPGPSAVLAALAVSGLATDRFVFEGFLPRRAGERRRRIMSLLAERRTLVLFESPRRVSGLLADLAELLGGDRRAVVCRELTKVHEEVVRGPLADLAEWARADAPLGEIAVVVAGAPARPPEPGQWPRAVAALVQRGMSKRDAVDEVAALHSVSRRQVYDVVLTDTMERGSAADPSRPATDH